MNIKEMFSGMSKEMAAQDNACTAKPLYCVYQKELRLVPPGFGDMIQYFDDEGHGRSEEEVRKLFEDMDETDKQTVLATEYDNADDVPIEVMARRMDMKKHFCEIVDVPVSGQVYLTKRGAQYHIDCNGYHYRKPFVYVESAWRNPEMQKLMQFVYNVENKGEYFR